MRYIAIDVETANSDYSSICQIGMAEFENGEILRSKSILLNPLQYFDAFNVGIHGITSESIKDAPSFYEFYEELKIWLADQVVIHHMPFDRVAISRACERHELEIPSAIWLDSAKIVRRTWPEFATKGYGLANISKHLNIEFEHHDALEDAIAAGKVLFEASKINNLTLEDLIVRASNPINTDKKPVQKSTYKKINMEGNPDGALFGEHIVFTGKLTLTRAEAATLSADLGCSVSSSVTSKTSILVVGILDSGQLAGFEKSSKHRRAEELINKGQRIKILSEKDFLKMVEISDKPN